MATKFFCSHCKVMEIYVIFSNTSLSRREYASAERTNDTADNSGVIARPSHQ